MTEVKKDKAEKADTKAAKESTVEEVEFTIPAEGPPDTTNDPLPEGEFTIPAEGPPDNTND